MFYEASIYSQIVSNKSILKRSEKKIYIREVLPCNSFSKILYIIKVKTINKALNLKQTAIFLSQY